MSAGGPLQFATPTSGTLQSVAELDDWTFFGRANQSVAIIVNTAIAGYPTPAQPSLNYAQVQLVDSSGIVLATSSNNQSGANAAILDVTLPADGTYQVEVSAPPAHSSSSGSYVLLVYDATIYTATTNLNHATYGQINSPYAQDQWTFSALASQQVQFELIGAANPSIQFSLTGPNGYTGFGALNASSGLLTLPASGTYALTVGGGATGAYAFQLVQTMQTSLTPGIPYQGTLTGSGQAQLFVFNVASSAPLFASLRDSSPGDQNELYAKFGSPPTREILLTTGPTVRVLRKASWCASFFARRRDLVRAGVCRVGGCRPQLASRSRWMRHTTAGNLRDAGALRDERGRGSTMTVNGSRVHQHHVLRTGRFGQYHSLSGQQCFL